MVVEGLWWWGVGAGDSGGYSGDCDCDGDGAGLGVELDEGLRTPWQVILDRWSLYLSSSLPPPPFSLGPAGPAKTNGSLQQQEQHSTAEAHHVSYALPSL